MVTGDEEERRMARAKSRFVDLLLCSDLTLARIVLGVASMAWAFILLALGDQSYRPSFVYLDRIAPQWAYGIAFGACGVLQFTRAIIGVPLSQGFYACTVAGISAWLWCAVTTAIALSIWPPPAMIASSLAMCVLSVFIFVRTVAKRD